MKKKIIIIVLIILVILAILSIPKKYGLKDGGTVVYEAITWKYEKVNTLEGYKGNRLYIFGIKVMDDVKLTKKQNKDVIDPNYDYNTEVKLDRTIWYSEKDQSWEYEFSKPNVKNGYTMKKYDNHGSYRIYTGKNLKKYENDFNASQENLKNLFNENTKDMTGEKIPFALVIDLEVDNNGNGMNATGQQTHFEYYGVYTYSKLVIAETGSYDNVIALNQLLPIE